MRYGGKGMWGKAVYFAQNASYSDANYCFKVMNCRKMFFAEIILGEIKTMPSNSELIKPPNKENG
jgi:hypothetical protein